MWSGCFRRAQEAGRCAMEISVLACGSDAGVQKGPIHDADRAVMAGFRDGQVGWTMSEVAGEEGGGRAVPTWCG